MNPTVFVTLLRPTKYTHKVIYSYVYGAIWSQTRFAFFGTKKVRLITSFITSSHNSHSLVLLWQLNLTAVLSQVEKIFCSLKHIQSSSTSNHCIRA